jgi:hypothetical protein
VGKNKIKIYIAKSLEHLSGAKYVENLDKEKIKMVLARHFLHRVGRLP